MMIDIQNRSGIWNRNPVYRLAETLAIGMTIRFSVSSTLVSLRFEGVQHNHELKNFNLQAQIQITEFLENGLAQK
jgi:hypothetical protein